MKTPVKTNTKKVALFFTVFMQLICSAQTKLKVPNPSAKPINQHTINSNGCGPVAQLNAYSFSSQKWRTTTDRIPGTTPGKRFEHLVLKYGNRASSHVQGRIRWNPQRGMSAPDLLDSINDFHTRARLPKLKLNSLFLEDKETQSQLLHRTHSRMKESIKNGLPPIIDIRRFAKKRNNGGFMWRSVFGHFVTIYEIPDKISPNATSIPIKYIDPSGGKILTGYIKIPKTNFFANDRTSKSDRSLKKSPCLEASFTNSHVGKKYLKKGEENILILSAIIGNF